MIPETYDIIEKKLVNGEYSIHYKILDNDKLVLAIYNNKTTSYIDNEIAIDFIKQYLELLDIKLECTLVKYKDIV